jgi:hypothetical protein
MSKEHFESLYKGLYDLYVECLQQGDETYREKIGMILDHMIYNKPHLYLK